MSFSTPRVSPTVCPQPSANSPVDIFHLVEFVSCHQVRLAVGFRLVGRLVDQFEAEVVLPLDAQHVIDQSVDQSAFAGPSSSYYQNGPLATTAEQGRVARLAENV